MGVHFYALAAETDEACRRCAQHVMPNIVHLDSVELLRVRDLRAMLQRRKFRGIILGGGSPCQGNSSLNSDRKGLEDPRSCQPTELARIRAELEAEPLCADLEIISWLENVASMPAEVKQQYSTWMRSDPILINAGPCGWVQRRRLFWLSSRLRGASKELQPPASWNWVESETHPIPELRYEGPKPIPGRVTWEDGYAPMLDPALVVSMKGEGAMHTFTREFRHPGDRLHQVSAEAANRFEIDHRRFPPGAYEEHSLVWRQDEWRTPSPDERSQVMGIPPAATEAVQGSEVHRTMTRNSMLGNGFHLPSILALFMLLPALLEAKIAPAPSAPDAALRARLQGSIWEPQRLDTFPDLVTSAAVIKAMRSCFADVPVPEELWTDTARRLQHCRLPRLQGFSGWMRLTGRPWSQLGPVPVFGRSRTQIYAGTSGQRYAAASSRGLDHLLPPGLGPERHMAASAGLGFPFTPKDWPEPDVGFVVHTLQLWREHLPNLASAQKQILQSVSVALRPLEDCLVQYRCTSAQKVATAKKPAFVCCLTTLLRWPDLLQGKHLLQGYPIVGEVNPCGVFRTITQDDKADIDEWLGEPATAAVDKLLRTGPPKHFEEIYKVTLEEQAKGFCSAFESRLTLDDRYGAGNWRPLERFMIVQPDGKQRVIDNAKKSGHNAHTTMSETITTVNVDFVASAARMVSTALFGHQPVPEEIPPWLGMRLGTDDLPDAYRGLPVCDDHLRFSIVAIYVPQVGWRFMTLYGLAYGLESAVIAFNRFPQLGIAIVRRCLLGFAAAYFDDELSVEFVRDADVTQRGLQLTFNLMGAPPQPSKTFAPACNRHYLGTSVHVGDSFLQGQVHFQPKQSTTWKVLTHLRHACHTRVLDRDVAGKLRGDLNWLWSMCAGHAGKLAGPLLTEKQQASDPDLTALDVWTLRLLESAITFSRPRTVSIAGAPMTPVRVYSDASFEAGVLRLGWIIFHPHQPPTGGTCRVPAATLASWTPRRQQIFPGETLAGLVVPLLHPALFQDADVLWFVDNEAAVSSLIRASSRQLDVHLISQYAQLVLFQLSSRVWFEWVDSKSNPSDGLSRLGLLDDWSTSQGWILKEYDFPEHLLPASFFQTFADLVV